MRTVAGEAKFTIADGDSYPGVACPNPRGWYHSVAGVVDTPEGLVAVYRRSDGRIVIADYTTAGFEPGVQPFLRAYLRGEDDLT